MPTTWSERYKFARNLLDHLILGEARGRVTDLEFGILVAQLMDPPRDPYSKASVSQWKYEQQEPPQRTVRAIAKLCGVDPGWLYFGNASSARAPAGWKEANADTNVFSPSAETARQLRELLEPIRNAAPSDVDTLPAARPASAERPRRVKSKKSQRRRAS